MITSGTSWTRSSSWEVSAPDTTPGSPTHGTASHATPSTASLENAADKDPLHEGVKSEAEGGAADCVER